MKRAISWICILITAGITSQAVAQQYPAKPVRIIVPSSAGGGQDMIARLLAEKLSPLGQPFIVDNRPGAGSNIGTEIVAKSAPDGYTLLVTTNVLTINQALMPKLPFHVLRDFTPIVTVASSPMVIGTKLAVPVQSLPELVQYAKTNRLSYASCGTGSPHHLVAEMLKAGAGIDMVHVPYKGCAPVNTDILNGNVDVFVNSLANVVPHMRAGKMKVFALTSAKRSTLAPEIPGLNEFAASKGIDIDGWYGLLGPQGMPATVVAQLNRAVNEFIGTPEMRSLLAARFFQPMGGSSDAFANIMKEDVATFTEVVRANKIASE
jgi:tripartite-type tricarboxylate transporter receptor subunit TctC